MSYSFPPLWLLSKTEDNITFHQNEIDRMENIVVGVFKLWNISVKAVDKRTTPISICFNLQLEEGSSIKNIKKMKSDFEVRLGCDIEIYESINNTVDIVVLPKERPLVGLRNLIDSEEFSSAKSPLAFAAGINYRGQIIMADIENLPHMLVAGTTGSGKTVFLDDLIMSILFKASPEQVKMIMIDPKNVDLTFYNGIPHLLAPVVYEEDKIFGMLSWIETESMRRLELFSSRGVKSLAKYNEKYTDEYIPQILVIIDEYSEFMNDHKSGFEVIIDRICGLGRTTGIHLIIATQRPTADVITSSIKNNMLCRASFTVVDSYESNAIINKAGAQRLLGAGDMLFSINSAVGMDHAQAPYVNSEEIKAVVKFITVNN